MGISNTFLWWQEKANVDIYVHVSYPVGLLSHSYIKVFRLNIYKNGHKSCAVLSIIIPNDIGFARPELLCNNMYKQKYNL